MKIKLICNKCNSKVKNLSIICENVLFREDVILKNGEFVSDGEEYFSGHVRETIYYCKNCGRVVDKFSKDERPLNLRNFMDSKLIAVEKNLKIIKG